MRVLILTIYHDPEPIPKTGELARELQRRGHQVHVVTAFPHYPSGNLYPGYRLALWRREVREGVPILRTFIYPYHGTSSVLRVVNYGTWMWSAMLASVLTPRCDVLYVWHPPLTVGVSAWVIAKLKRVRFVYDVQDLWPESAVASGLMKPGRMVNFLTRLADWVYARADRILVVSKAAAAHLRERGVDSRKLFVARHWLEPSAFAASRDEQDVSDTGRLNRFVVLFAGNLGLVQGLDTVIRAAALLRHEPIDFVFVGDGSDRQRLERLTAELNLTNVRFEGQHPASEMPRFMRSADALLVHLRRSSVAEHAVPTKMLSYLAAGRPILCATGGASAEVVSEAGAGVVAPPDDPHALANAVRQLSIMPADARKRLGDNGRAYFAEHFEKSRVIDFYEQILQDTART